MSRTHKYLAFDLGAESGRAVVGTYNGEKIELTPIHRFSNGPVDVFGSLYWNVLRLFDEMKQGLHVYQQQYGDELDGIGVDTWGVDFGLIGATGELLGLPRNYRDPRTDGMLTKAFDIVPREQIFDATGIQFMQINTLYQLLSIKLAGDPVLDQAAALLMMPDLLTYWLTGIKHAEYSIASTSQCYDPRKKDWARPLLSALGIPTHIFQDVIQPGTVVGMLHPSLEAETGLENVQIVAPGGHDTACAVAAVPAQSSDYAYISSGTWSLMGVESAEPVVTPESLAFNFTNEGGVCETTRLLKNIMGLWLVQQCRSTWAQEGIELSYSEITELAAAAPAFGPIVEPDHHDFLQPGDMPARIQAFCVKTGQPLPETKGEIIRCALESLVLKYRWVLEKLEIMQNKRLNTIHIVGGGSQNELLCQLTADATQRLVIAGPVEATATGNVMMQAIGQGHIASLAEGREIVRRSFALKTFEPSSQDGWDQAYERFLAIQEQFPEG